MNLKISLHCPVCQEKLIDRCIRDGEYYILPCKNGCNREMYNEKLKKHTAEKRSAEATSYEDFSTPRCRADLPYNTR